MALMQCPECKNQVSDSAPTCPGCGYIINKNALPLHQFKRWGFEYKSKTTFLGLPLVHITLGFDKKTNKLLVSKGIIAIGQFAIGVITIAQFGIGVFFGFGQFILGAIAVAQFAIGVMFGAGQFATGYTVIGQFALGKFVLAMKGFGQHVWSKDVADPLAKEHFLNLWSQIKEFLPFSSAARN